MREWAKAGVEGGIPHRNANRVVETVSASGNRDMAPSIQSAIDAAHRAGGGVVLLRRGTFAIQSKITMKSNVILRGEGKRDTVLECTMTHRGKKSGDRIETILVSGRQIGLEDFALVYKVTWQGKRLHPLDTDWGSKTWYEYSKRRQNFENERIYYDRENFRYEKKGDMFVTFVRVTGGSTRNVWIDDCSFLESASDAVFIQEGEHITVRDTLISGSFQKGGSGNGYGLNVYGRYVLMTGVSIFKMRHWAIQLGAEYCVVYKCNSEVDMNFHQGDKGRNLIEKTRIHIPYWGPWDVFQPGASYHGPPGDANMFFDNDCVEKQRGRKYTDNKIYTFKGRSIGEHKLGTPRYGTLYAVKYTGGSSPQLPPSTSPKTPPRRPSNGCSQRIKKWGNCTKKPNCCATGSTCRRRNKWYSQCV